MERAGWQLVAGEPGLNGDALFSKFHQGTRPHLQPPDTVGPIRGKVWLQKAVQELEAWHLEGLLVVASEERVTLGQGCPQD